MSLNWNYAKPSCCAKWLVLPTVYSDALSYGEQLDKFCYQLNELIANNNILPDFISEMIKEYINSGAIGEVVRDILADYILNVKYPPKGIAPAVGDGSADDTASIQGCIDYAAENGGVVYFPYGSYLTQPLTMKNGVSLFGFDRYSTKIVLKGGATKPLIGGTVADFSIANLTLDGNSGIQVNDVNVVTIMGTNVLFTNLIIKDGYTLVNYDGTGGHFQISDVVFGNAVKKCLITTGNADVQCENVVFNQLSAVGGISVMDIGTDGGFFNMKSVATCNQCIIVTGNNNKISAIVKNAAIPVVDNGSNNNIEIFGISNKEFYSDDTTKKVGGNYSKHIAGSYTKDVDGNATEIVDGIFSSTVKGASSETFDSNRIINENNKTVNNKGVLTETVSRKVTKNYGNDYEETVSGKVTKNYGNGCEETVVGNKETTADNYAVNSKSLVVNCEEPMTYKRQVKDLNKYFNSFEVKDINNVVRDVLVYKKDFELPIVNVVDMGVDNTGARDVGGELSDLFLTFDGRRIYFPKGIYLVNSTVKMRTDEPYHGVIMECDPDAKFVTTGVAVMFEFGNGNTQYELTDFGMDGGYIDAKNVTQTVMLINDNQYSCKLSRFIIRNVGDIIGIKICNDSNTSSQVKMDRITVTGDGTVKGDGIAIYGTDNFMSNVNIGRMRRNLVIAGGGNKIQGLHTWNYGREYAALDALSPNDKLTYPSIRVNGSNVFSDLQVDNGTPAMQFTNNAIMNAIGEASFNYESDFPWGTELDKCCAVQVLGNNATIGSNLKINSVNFAPPANTHVRLIDFPAYNENFLYWLQKQTWDIGSTCGRELLLRRLEGDFGRSIIDSNFKTILSTYITNNDPTKCILLGYIGVNGKNFNSLLRFSDSANKGYIDALIINTNNVITCELNLTGQFSNAGNLIVGTDIVTLCDKKFVPVYVQFTSAGTILKGITCKAIALSDCCTSFVTNRAPSYYDIPSNAVMQSLR